MLPFSFCTLEVKFAPGKQISSSSGHQSLTISGPLLANSQRDQISREGLLDTIPGQTFCIIARHSKTTHQLQLMAPAPYACGQTGQTVEEEWLADRKGLPCPGMQQPQYVKKPVLTYVMAFLQLTSSQLRYPRLSTT